MFISEFEFLFLGTGTSTGVPIIACDCEVCRSEDPRDQRLRTSAALRFRDSGGTQRVLLIDTSPDLRAQALRHQLTRLDAIIYTHDHFDHIFGLDEVRRFNAVMGDQPIAVYADDATSLSLHRVFQHIFQKHRNANRSFIATLEEQRIDPDVDVRLFGLRFRPLRLMHGNLPILGFRIEAVDERGEPIAEQPGPLPLAYMTDVSEIPSATWPQLSGLRTLVLDMLRFSSHRTHFSYDEAVEAATKIQAARTYFVHMTHDLGHAKVDASLPEAMSLSYDGLVLR
ncbi:MAG: MBL fold metallo-hydrolase [Planctomycetota bacterium]